jgi:inositol 1,4,5-triphosphate receptor type 1
MFLNHVKFEHNMWNYIYFISHLQEKDETEFNGEESYVWDKLENKDVTWIPIGR